MAAVATGLSPQQIQALIQQRLLALRVAYNSIIDLYRWTSGLAASDLATAAGLSTGDAGTYLSAVSDAYAEAQIHYSGLPPLSYPQPSSDYIYSTSQSQVIGPQ
jgi:hypothetical protein